LTYVCTRIHVLDRVQDRTNPFAAARGNKRAMWPFATLPWTLVGQWHQRANTMGVI